jgi:hypothetical protein
LDDAFLSVAGRVANYGGTHVRRVSLRHRILGGGLLLATAIGAYEHFGRSEGPRTAQAGQAPAGVSAAPSQDWQTVNELVARLTADNYTPVEDLPADDSRDLFRPTPFLEGQIPLATPDANDAGPEAPPDQPGAPAPPAFIDRHQLTGVLLGRERLAVIDGRVYRLGDLLDGHALAEINREDVVLIEATTRARIVLRLRTSRAVQGMPVNSAPVAAEGP